MKKRLAGLWIAVVMLASVLISCSSSKDAEAYVKGVLDIAYNKGTEDYVKATGAKEVDAKKYMEQSVEAESKILAAYFGIEEPSDEVIEAFKPVVEQLYEGIQYEVEADGDKVTISATDAGFPFSEEAQQYLDDYVVKRYVDGDTSCTDESFAKAMAELLLKEMETAKCGTMVNSVEITVTEKDGGYSISDEDLVKLDEEIISYP